MIEVIKDFHGTYPNDPLRNINFDKYAEKGRDCLLYLSTKLPQTIISDVEKPKYWFNAEEQLYNYGSNLDTINSFIDKVDYLFTVFPDYLEKRNKRIYTFFPIDMEIVDSIPKNLVKKYSSIYTGGVYGGHINEIAESVKSLNGCLLSHAPNVSYIEKLNLISESLVTVCHNLIIPLNGKCSGPQLKTRCFEAAACKSLMLVLKDSYNVVEDWFTPNKDFIYYEEGNLKETLNHCVNNYTKYQDLVDSAYERFTKNYTTLNFIEKYLK